MKVDLDLIRVESNVRDLAPEPDPSLVLSIQEKGLLQPVAVIEVDDVYQLVDGHRRLAAFEVARPGEPIPAHVLNGGSTTDADVIGSQIQANDLREDMTAWQRAQAAMDLKELGLKQADVATQMGVSKSDVSKLQKIAKLDVGDQGNMLTFDALLEMASSERLENAPDGAAPLVVEQLVTGEARAISHALSNVEREFEVAEFYNELAEHQTAWGEAGIQVTTTNPVHHWDKKDKNGYARKDPKVVQIGRTYGSDSIEIDLEKHMALDCHMIWIYEPNNNWGKPEVRHYCMNRKSHEAAGDSKLKRKGAKSDAKEKAEASADRRAKKEAKELRVLKAEMWMRRLPSKALALQLAITEALSGYGWKEEHTRSFVKALIAVGTIEKRPTGAEYSWYQKELDAYLDGRGWDHDQQQLFKVKFLHAYKYIEDTWPKEFVSEAIEAMEVTTDE